MAVVVAGCAAPMPPHGHWLVPPTQTAGTFVMRDGTLLPYRQWLPVGAPKAVILALHGMNDSRDAWEYPAPAFVAAGFAIFAPDQRGFGATASRGRWAGTGILAADARTVATELRRRYPDTRLIVMAESMGAATAMVLATEPAASPVDGPIDGPVDRPIDGYVLIAPAVWSRANMNFFMRASLWVADRVAPAMTLTGGGFVKVTATDNREALQRLSTDPLTIHETRVDAIKGLVDLMDRAAADAGRFQAPALFLYGGHDELVPPRATAAAWQALGRGLDGRPSGPTWGGHTLRPAGRPTGGPTLAFYPGGYHLLLRDTERDAAIGDIIAWIEHPRRALPSGADRTAMAWLARQPTGGAAALRNPTAAP
jgi:acylglycerol lipase